MSVKILVKKGALLLTLPFFSLWGSAQTESDLSDEAYIVPYQYIKISVSPVLYQNLSISEYGQKKLLKSRPTLSGEITASYFYRLNKKYYLSIGAGIGLVPFNFCYNFKTPENSVFLKGDRAKYYEYMDNNHYEYIQSMWVFPFSIQKHIKSKRLNKHLTWELGLKYNNVVAYPYKITTGHLLVTTDSTEARLFQLQMFDTKKHLFSGFFKVGMIKFYKSQNAIHLNAVLHLSPMKMGMGSYEFSNLPFSSKGQVSQKLNYIGFECAFSFPLNKVYTPDQ